jgi:hypothetical protein
MGNPKIATCSLLPCVRLHYSCGFHSPSKQMVAASEPTLTPVTDQQ